MSKNMYWRPARTEATSIPDRLRQILVPKVFGSIPLPNDVASLDQLIIPYLQGLQDAGVEGAAHLIGAIRNHRVIDVWIDE